MNQVRDLESMIATTGVSQGFLGHLFWFSIGKQMNKKDDIKIKMEEAGLDEGWLPASIRSTDAFRRATSEAKLRKKTSNAKVVKNIMVREVYTDNKEIQRNLVVEVVDQENKELRYDSQSAVITLNKKYGDLSIHAEEDEIKEICNDVKDRFYLYRDHYNSQHMRVMVSKILSSLAPIPMRENGVIYFVPEQVTKGLTNLVTFINSLDNSDAFKVPVIDSSENKEMVNIRLSSYLDLLLEQIRNSDDLQKGQIKQLIADTNQAIEDYQNYKSITATEQEEFKKKLIHLRREVTSLMQE